MKVIFTLEAYQKWRAYINALHYEISGLGRVRYLRGVFYIDDIRIFHQEVTAASTILDRNALGLFYDELMQKGEDTSLWKVWWHSHGDLETFFSSIDHATIESFDNETPQENWLLSIVSNRKLDTEIRLDVFSPLRLTTEHISYEIDLENPLIERQVLQEVAQKVRLFTPPSPKNVPIPLLGANGKVKFAPKSKPLIPDAEIV